MRRSRLKVVSYYSITPFAELILSAARDSILSDEMRSAEFAIAASSVIRDTMKVDPRTIEWEVIPWDVNPAALRNLDQAMMPLPIQEVDDD